MAMIHLIKGGSFFEAIQDYNRKGKFLVVALSEITVNGIKDRRIVSWDNIESVLVSEEEQGAST